jgi:hypothetical protein
LLDADIALNFSDGTGDRISSDYRRIERVLSSPSSKCCLTKKL